MYKQMRGLAVLIAVFAMSAAAQTVTSSGTTGTVNNVPYISAATSTSTTLGASPITVSASGSNVGISNTAPTSILEVAPVSTNSANAGSTNEIVRLQGYMPDPTVNATTSYFRQQFDHTNSYNYYAKTTRGANGSYFNWSFGGAFGGAESDMLTLTRSGNVGIGTTSPKNPLEVAPQTADSSVPTAGTIDSGTALYLTLGGGFGLLGSVLNNGNAWLQAQRTDSTSTTYNYVASTQWRQSRHWNYSTRPDAGCQRNHLHGA